MKDDPGVSRGQLVRSVKQKITAIDDREERALHNLKSQPHTTITTTTTQCKLQICSCACVHTSKCLVRKGKEHLQCKLQWAVAAYMASHVCTIVAKCDTLYKKNTTSTSCM